eukprot:TRINITY_DN9143_c0_g1_i1.p1 TRINITY_DN9143_c0_g1~~TRINITY_DN9143_c0_g1_i1.p1  ORF type:complete len:483 (-),score=76.32 TRINITY_DN9143_c0_g1_i1:820-2232(-)
MASAECAPDRGVHRKAAAGDKKDVPYEMREGDRICALWVEDGTWLPCHFVAWKGLARRPKVMWDDGTVLRLETDQVRPMTPAEIEKEERRRAKHRSAHKQIVEAELCGKRPMTLDSFVQGTRKSEEAVAVKLEDGSGTVARKRAKKTTVGDGCGGDNGTEAAARVPEPLALGSRHQLPAHKYVLAPMVGGSELPYRMLTRCFGTELCYTPMMYSLPFSQDAEYRASVENGFHTCPGDRPLVAHFCGNDPEVLLAAAKHVVKDVDAIDLNLGCPQRVAHAGHFGSYLLGEQDRELLMSVVKRLSDSLPIPVFCKIRLLDTPADTLKLVKQLEASGAALIAVHARYRGTPERRRDGPAHLDQVPALKQALRIPLLANGNVRSWDDVVANLELTGADGIMSAEGMLDDPCLFAPGVGMITATSKQGSGKGAANQAELRKIEKKLRQIEALEKNIQTEPSCRRRRKRRWRRRRR